MNVLIPLLFGLGAFCVWWSFWPKETAEKPSATARLRDDLQDDLAHAGFHSTSPTQLLVLSVGALIIVFLIGMATIGVPAVAAVFAGMGGYAPIAFVRSRARKRRNSLREVWPDVVDHISSAVRAGLALPESLAQLAVRGPEELRPAFAEFAHDYRASGKFHESLDALKVRLSDPVADRLIESLRIAREVGGTDLGRLLRTLSGFLREDARTRSELEARQSWTVNAARLALCAPWIVLAMLATRGQSLEAYRHPTGVLILLFGGGVSLVAYRIMRQIGRLPQEVRVMR